MPVRFHRPRHPREVRLLVLRRHPRPAIGEQTRQIILAHHAQPPGRDLVHPYRGLRRRHVTMRAARCRHNLPVTTALQQQGHDQPVIRHRRMCLRARRRRPVRRHEQPDHTESTALPAIQNRATNSTDSRYQDRSFARCRGQGLGADHRARGCVTSATFPRKRLVRNFTSRLRGTRVRSRRQHRIVLSCRMSRVEGRRAARSKPGRALRESRLLAQARAGRRDLK